MLRVTVEILPATSSPRRQIAVLEIANMTDCKALSDYHVRADTDQGAYSFELVCHERSAGWQPLVERAIEKLNRLRKEREHGG